MPKNSTKVSLGKKLVRHAKQNLKDPKSAPLVFIGFDGFTDEIIKVVSNRTTFDEYQPYKTIRSFGEKILEASDKSCNLELVVQLKKLGGNAPIMTNALLEGAPRVHFAGPIGVKGDIEPLFQSMADRCEKVYALGPSAHSDALEFNDGKVILGKMESLKNVNYDNLLRLITPSKLFNLLDHADLFVSANWTMLPTMNEIWKRLAGDILPKLSPKARWMFVDLADPAKRSDADLKEALRLLKLFGKHFNVVLGLNLAEGLRVGTVLKLPCAKDTESSAAELAKCISAKAGLSHVVVHAMKYAVCATPDEVWEVKGPYTPNPEFSTGAGDNFNAGFCNALLCGCSIEECLISGVYTSGFYVRNGRSPSIQELSSFLIKI